MQPTPTQQKIMNATGASLRDTVIAEAEMNAEANMKINASAIEQKLLALCRDNLPLLNETWECLRRDFNIANRDAKGLLAHFKSVEKAQAQLPYIVELARKNIEAAAPPPPEPEYKYFYKDVDGLSGSVDKSVTPNVFMTELKSILKERGIVLPNLTIDCSIDAYPYLKNVMDSYSLKAPVLDMGLDDMAFKVRTPDKAKATKG